MPTASGKTPVTLVTGLNREATARIANTLAVSGTALISHDLRALPLGYVVRQTRNVIGDADLFAIEGVQLEHGCATCTLRHDLLPMLRTLHRTPGVERIVVVLDPAFEPEPVVDEIAHTLVESEDLPEGTAGDDVEVISCVTAVAADSWLNDATGDLTVCEAGISEVEDERTLAQIAIAQVRFGDVLVITGAPSPDHYEEARLSAALRRINPAAIQHPVAHGGAFGIADMLISLAAVRPESRRGRVSTIFDPLLDGCPPLDADCGIEIVVFEAARPFHPGRLHDALDVLLDGVICSRGRVWLTSSNDDVLWLESAGESLGIAKAGRWLAARDETELDDIAPQVRAMAALRWDARHGDRHSSIVAVTHRADAAEIERALTGALVTDDELARGSDYLATLESPFGDDHHDPCDPDRTLTPIDSEETTR
ncbi:GTP-binding protein [Gordonia sp. (in: high G+C Gram-positive bacteria)]|uniref:ribosome hibernation factor-recruiting GTPase MRF n=1 Tax=Gordonia sp. (in: high G+C Gram-positive bacteria) TaxID=84139 RepID=UPI0026082055|nr:GTP-binding protein [Gordonia sp. (in: high G+C Gram-positive bacteria)]